MLGTSRRIINKARELLHKRVVTCMLGSLNKEKEMGKVLLSIQMAQNMLGSSKKIRKMEKEPIH